MKQKIKQPEIQKNLVRGDLKKIAQAIGYKPEKLRQGSQYVSKVLNGHTCNTNGLVKNQILGIARELAETNKINNQ